MKNKATYADYMIIATCRSTRHANAVAEDLVKKFKKMNFNCPQPEGRPKCDWTIVDSGSVIVHLFKPEIRSHYNLEKLWDISFDSQNNKFY